MINNMQL